MDTRLEESRLSSTDLERLVPVLRRAWASPFTTRSDFARSNAEEVAIAACLKLLTVTHHNHLNEWGRTWRITSTGLRLLETIP